MILPTPPDLPFLSPNFGSHMVLQRDKPNTFWGWTTPGDKVRVTIGARVSTGKAGPDGKWTVRFDPPKVGGPYKVYVATESQSVTHRDDLPGVEIRGPRQVAVLEDVLVGDVWLCTGQSNMEFGLTQANGGTEVANADRPQMRLFMVPRQVGYAPRAVDGGTWKVCTPATVAQDGWGGFSAVGYSFGRKVQDAVRVPIGLVEDCWGGTSAEAWTSAVGLAPLGDFGTPLATVAERAAKDRPVFGTYKNVWLDENDPGVREGWQAADFDDSGWARVAPLHLLPDAERSPSVAWFRKTVDVPQGGPATLYLNRIDDTDTTWVNGEFVGTTSFDWAWRRYPVTLKPGRNTIALRVFTTPDRPAFLGKPDEIRLETASGARIPLTDNWSAKTSLDAATLSSRPRDTEPNPTVPSVLYNGMVAPLAPMAIKGAIWYQGETNVGRAAQYRRLLPALIADWRRAFGQGDFPFYIASLAAFLPRDPNPGDDAWAELRDAQAHTARAVPNGGLALTIDVGDAADVHPKDKRTVGERLALVALAKAYGQGLEYSGPTYRSMELSGDSVKLRFDHAKGLNSSKPGLSSRAPLGFAVAGEDRKWRWASAKIENDGSIVVRSPDVPRPVAVRYGWGHNPDVSLTNGAGLPAVPFRTDDWPLVTRDAR